MKKDILKKLLRRKKHIENNEEEVESYTTRLFIVFALMLLITTFIGYISFNYFKPSDDPSNKVKSCKDYKNQIRS